jgi:hypothetical protein
VSNTEDVKKIVEKHRNPMNCTTVKKTEITPSTNGKFYPMSNPSK